MRRRAAGCRWHRKVWRRRRLPIATALDLGVEVVPVLNKMDLPQADPEAAKAEIEDVIGIDASEAIPCSAKAGWVWTISWR